jgi:ribokinase
MPQVVVLGDINLDVIARVSSYPAPGGDGLATRAVVRPGGSAANVAAGLARLGLKVALIGRVGQDPLGELALAALAEVGVDLSAIQRDPTTMTGLMFIPVTPDGERTMFGYRGANPHTELPATAPALFDGTRIFHLSGYALLEPPQSRAALQALTLARDAGAVLSLDPAHEGVTCCTDMIRSFLPDLGLLLLNEVEASRLSDQADPLDAARTLVADGVGLVAVKLGPTGCIVASAEGWARLPAFEIDAVDSTGAGDAFDAGFLYARLSGLAMTSAALLANAVGAVVTTREGGLPPAPGEVAELLWAHQKRPRWRDCRVEFAEALAFLSG